jgi:hypothetical protein
MVEASGKERPAPLGLTHSRAPWRAAGPTRMRWRNSPRRSDTPGRSSGRMWTSCLRRPEEATRSDPRRVASRRGTSPTATHSLHLRRREGLTVGAIAAKAVGGSAAGAVGHDGAKGGSGPDRRRAARHHQRRGAGAAGCGRDAELSRARAALASWVSRAWAAPFARARRSCCASRLPTRSSTATARRLRRPSAARGALSSPRAEHARRARGDSTPAPPGRSRRPR